MDILKKCVISRYDETIKEPPFLTIPIDTVEVMEPEDNKDDLGVRFSIRLKEACKSKGYTFKFYTMCREERGDAYKGMDYEIVVYGENEHIQGWIGIFNEYIY